MVYIVNDHKEEEGQHLHRAGIELIFCPIHFLFSYLLIKCNKYFYLVGIRPYKKSEILLIHETLVEHVQTLQ